MFGNLDKEKEFWDKYFGFFQEKFDEKLGIAPAVHESDDYEVDFTIGQESNNILGIRVYQFVPVPAEDVPDEVAEKMKAKQEESEQSSETDKEKTKSEKSKDMYQVYLFDLVREESTDIDTSDLEETLSFEYSNPMFEKENELITQVTFYKNEHNEIILAKETKGDEKEIISVFSLDPELIKLLET